MRAFFRLLGSLAGLLLLTSCPNPFMDAVKAKVASEEAKSIGVFGFEAARNAKLYTDVAGTVDEANHAIALVVPKWVPLAGLVATFQFSGATVTVNGTEQQSGVTANDFTQPVTYTVTPTSGTPVTYTVTATTGAQGLMGGVIQGSPLSLSGQVTTVAGKASPFGTPGGVVRVGSTVYVADSTYQVIWQVSASNGTMSVFAGTLYTAGYNDAVGTAAKFNSPFGLATDGTTYLYVADTNNNVIRRVALADGTVDTLTGTYPTAGTTDGGPGTALFDGPYGLYFDGASTLYETDLNQGSLRKITTGGTVTTMVAGTMSIPTGMVVDTLKTYLYVTDQGNNCIYKVATGSPYTTTVYSGSSSGTSGHQDGAANSALFWGPTGIVHIGTFYYVSDLYNQVIRKVSDSDGSTSVAFGSYTQYGSTQNIWRGDWADGSSGGLLYYLPAMMYYYTSAPATLYIAEQGNYDLRTITNPTSTAIGSTLAGVHPGATNATGASARFNLPRGLASNGTTLWIGDEFNELIRSMDIASAAVSTLAGQAGVVGNTDATGTAASFTFPYGVTTDGKSLFVCDTYSSTIRRIDLSTGAVTTMAGGGPGTESDGTGTGASFQRPAGITTDGTYLYVCDYLNNAIRRVTISTAEVITFAGSTSATAGDTDGVGTAAKFRRPIGVTTDGTYLYVGDGSNNKIRRVRLSDATVDTFVGPGPGATTSGYLNAVGNAALLSFPNGLTTDGTSLFVVDMNNQAIRKVDIATKTVTTLAGSAAPGGIPGEVDGLGSAALFSQPFAIATDGRSIYVTDNGGHVIRRID